MESIIKWQTGEPKEDGCYIVTIENSSKETGVTVLNYGTKNKKFLLVGLYPDLKIIAWCNLSDIEPYKTE